MRDIEFRGQVIDEPYEWVYGYLMPNNTIYQNDKPSKCCGIGMFPVVPESIGQYTGCRDVNNVKIFENDIVKEVYGSRYYQVVYDKHSFMLDPILVDTHFYQTWINPKRLEVIGNSYTTQEGERKIYEREQETSNIFKRFCKYLRRFL